MSIIDEELAKKFLEDPKSVDLSKATEITDGAAELLSKHEGYLELVGLTQLSDAAAESLAKHQSGTLYFELKNYRRISPTVIEKGEERPFYSNEGGEWTDEADFIFEWRGLIDWGIVNPDALGGLSDAVKALTESKSVTVHIKYVENDKGGFTYIDHKHDVDKVEDKFLKLFAPVAKDAILDNSWDFPIDLRDDWNVYWKSHGENWFPAVKEAYPNFIRKYSNADGSVGD